MKPNEGTAKQKKLQTQIEELIIYNGALGTMKLNKNDEQVIAALKEKDLTLAELAEKTGVPSKKVFKTLKKLFEHEMIDSNARKYRLLREKPPANKGKEEDAATEDE